MAKDDGALFDTNDGEDGHHVTSYTLLAIDQFVKPSSWCPNGHIVEWTNEETGVSVVMVRRVNTDNMTTEPICSVCGLPPNSPGPEEAPDGEVKDY